MQQLIHRHDPEVENLVIASLLTDPGGFDTVDGQWPDEAFYVERNRKIYRAAWQTYRDTGCADITLIRSRLKEADQAPVALQLIGILNEAWESISFSAWLLPAYAKRLRKLFVEREKGKAALQYQAAIADGRDEHEARIILDSILDSLDRMTPVESSDEAIATLIGENARYPSGISTLDRLAGGMTKPGLNILAARPSVGKSALARRIIRSAAARGDTVFWYSIDQSAGQVYELEIAHRTKQDTTRLRKMQPDELVERIRDVRENVWRDRVILIDQPLELGQLLSFARSSTASLVVIDYLQNVNTGASDSEYESVTKASKAFKALALQMGVPVLALAQLNRAAEHGKVPSLKDLRSSGQIEQDADQVWILERDTTGTSSEASKAELSVLKNKTGPTTKVNLTWVGKYATYEEYADGRYAS